MKPFRLQYASNLFAFHCSKAARQALKPGAAPTLALLGNTLNVSTPARAAETREFLRFCATEWDRTLIVLGPHEYASPVMRLYADVRDELINTIQATGGGRFYVLDQDSVTFKRHGIRVLGCSGWAAAPVSRIKELEPELTDLWTHEGNFTSETVAERHDEDMEWLHREVQESEGGRTLLLTHSLPSPHLLNRGLPTVAYERMTFDILLNTVSGRIEQPGLIGWLGGATGSCASGSWGPYKIYKAVNSWKSHPRQTKPNPAFLADAVFEFAPRPPPPRLGRFAQPTSPLLASVFGALPALEPSVFQPLLM